MNIARFFSPIFSKREEFIFLKNIIINFGI